MTADEDKTKVDGDSAGDGKPAGKAAQERRERRERPPVTIDLAAADVQATPVNKVEPAKPSPGDAPPVTGGPTPKPSAPSPSEKAPPMAASTASRSGGRADALRGAAARALGDDGWRQTLASAVAGALIALVLVVVLQAIGLLPSSGRSTANQAAEQAKSAADATVALERRVTAIETMTEGLPALKSDLKTFGDRIQALESGRDTLATRSDLEALTAAVAALREKLDATPATASRTDLTALTDRIGRLEVAAAAGGGAGGDNSAALNSLSDQLTAAEASLRSLTDRLAVAEAKMAAPAPGANDTAVRAIAVASLRRASEGDKPFVADVDMVSALGIANDDIASLRAFAVDGIPSKASLAAAFPPVADAILSAAANSDPNAGFFQRVLTGLGGLVSIRPTGPIAGGDPEAIVSRMTADVAADDLAGALGERDALPPAAKDASADWAAKAASRVALDQLIGRIAIALGAARS